MLTQATHLTAQTNTAYHKMGHLIGAAKRWDISAAYCAHTSNTSNSTNKHSLSQDGSSDRSRQEMGHLSSILCSHKQQHLTAQTNTAYHKMGHLIGAAKRWDISAAYCAHTSNTSNSTNKHSLSQDGSSDRSRQEMGHLSSILCSHKQQHLTAQTNTAYHKMGHLIGAAKRWDISAAYCAHTRQTQPITRWVIRYELPKDGASQQHTVLTHPTQTQPPGCGSCQSKQEPSKRCPTDVPYSTLNVVGATNHNTLSPWHAQDSIVCFNWES